MKINFWQVLGGLLLLLGLAGIIYREFIAAPASTTTPATMTAPDAATGSMTPATQPAS